MYFQYDDLFCDPRVMNYRFKVWMMRQTLFGSSDSACLKACLMPIKIHTAPTSSIFCIAFLIQLMSHYSGGLPVVIEGTNMDSANQYQLIGGSFPFKVRLMVSFRAYSTVPIKSSDQIGP